MIKFSIAIFFLVALPILSNGQENCTLRKDQEGIKVYLCETEGSAFKTIKVAFEAKGNLKCYASGVLNVKGYSKWQVSIDTTYILEQQSKTELMYYAEIETPWPISHRDLIFHLHVIQNKASKILTISLKQLPSYIPKKEDIVRIPFAESTLIVTPINSNRLKVEYTLQVNPGGDIPAFIANMFAANTPWNTFYNFRKKLETNEFEINDSLPIENY